MISPFSAMPYDKRDNNDRTSRKRHVLYGILLLFFLSTLIMLRQLLSSGYFAVRVQDTFTYTSWAWQFTEALKEEIVYPRWTWLDFWGYGSPTFILYPPLAFYLAAFFNIFTHSLPAAMNFTKFISLFLSAVGMYFLVREFYSEKIALRTSVLYIFFPFVIYDLYIVGNFASTVSFMWFSPILLFTYRYIRGRKYKDIMYSGVCYGGLILTHLINAYMFTFVVLAFIAGMALNRKAPKDLIVMPAISMMGILVSAAYILPVIYEKKFINLKAFIGVAFNFADHFFNHDWHHRIEFLCYMIFFAALILIFFFLAFKLNSKIGKDTSTANKSFLAAAVFSILLLSEISTPVWETVPFFKYIQFPVRWMSITGFIIIFLSACGFKFIDSIFGTRKDSYFIIAAVFLIFFFPDFKYLNSAIVFTAEELMPAQAINCAKEHLPSTADIKKLDKDSKKAVILVGTGNAEVVEWKAEERVIQIKASQPITLRIRTFNFTGWKAYIDNIEAAIRTEKGSGAILVDVPEGSHVVKLFFADTPIRYWSKLISLVSLIIVSTVFLLDKSKALRLTKIKAKET